MAISETDEIKGYLEIKTKPKLISILYSGCWDEDYLLKMEVGLVIQGNTVFSSFRPELSFDAQSEDPDVKRYALLLNSQTGSLRQEELLSV